MSRETAPSGIGSSAEEVVGKRRVRWQRVAGFLSSYGFVLPAVVFLLIVSIYPLFYAARLSFQEVQQGQWQSVGLQHYADLLGDPWFTNSLKIIVIFAIANMVLHLTIGMFFALLLNEEWFSTTARNIMRGILILPWIFSTAAASLMWSLLYHPFGLFNYITTTLLGRSQPIEYLGDTRLALWSIVAVSAWKWYPFYMLIILGGLQAIPGELYEAAEVDGANAWHRFRYITLPQLRSVLVAISAIDIITTFSHVDLFKMLTRGGPLRTTESVAYYIYKTAMLDGNHGYGAAISVLVLLTLILFMVVYMRLLSRGGQAGEPAF